MIDHLQRLALSARPLRYLALAGCVLFPLLLAITLFGEPGSGDDQYLLLSATGLLWSLSGYAFIVNFTAVPPRAESDAGFFLRLRRRLHRSWYWLLALVFLATTATALGITVRMLFIWIRSLG